MKKKKVIIIGVFVILFAWIGIWSILPGYSSTLKANWGISLPAKALCSEVYKKDTGSSFHGDGIRYHVFSYKYEDDIDLMFAWSDAERETLFYSSLSEAATAWLDEIEVPEAQRPDYEACLFWYTAKEDNSEILFFWNPEINQLYIVESFL